MQHRLRVLASARVIDPRPSHTLRGALALRTDSTARSKVVNDPVARLDPSNNQENLPLSHPLNKTGDAEPLQRPGPGVGIPFADTAIFGEATGHVRSLTHPGKVDVGGRLAQRVKERRLILWFIGRAIVAQVIGRLILTKLSGLKTKKNLCR